MLVFLGRTNDEKGAQLELFSRDLLAQLKFENIRTNAIGAGGEEIDVAGEVLFPMPTGNRRRKLICECKATRKPSDMTEWLKFLGKVYSATRNRNEEVFGCFIALGGVNGNVFGHYERLKEGHDEVSIMSREELVAHVAALHPHATLEQILAATKRRTQRPIAEAQLAYFDRAVYWVIEFNAGKFTLLSASGQRIDDADRLALLQQMVPLQLEGRTFVDLDEEDLAVSRRVQAMKQVIARLLIVSEATVPELCESLAPIAPDDVTCGAEAATAQKWTTEVDGRLSLSLPPLGETSSTFVEILRFLFGGQEFPLRALGAPLLDQRINPALVDMICTIQGDLPLDADQRRAVLELIRLSPTALKAAITPDELVISMRRNQKLQEFARGLMDRESARIFLRALQESLLRDYRSRELGRHFFDRGVVEVEVRQTVQVKSRERLVFEGSLRTRHGLGEVAKNHGGGLWSMWVPESAPEPWVTYASPPKTEGEVVAS